MLTRDEFLSRVEALVDASEEHPDPEIRAAGGILCAAMGSVVDHDSVRFLAFIVRAYAEPAIKRLKREELGVTRQ